MAEELKAFGAILVSDSQKYLGRLCLNAAVKVFAAFAAATPQ